MPLCKFLIFIVRTLVINNTLKYFINTLYYKSGEFCVDFFAVAKMAIDFLKNNYSAAEINTTTLVQVDFSCNRFIAVSFLVRKIVMDDHSKSLDELASFLQQRSICAISFYGHLVDLVYSSFHPA